MTGDILAIVFGSISIVMSLTIELSQLYAIFKTKNTSGTSLTTYIIFFFSSILWILWSIAFYLANMYGTQSTAEPTLLHLAGFVPAILNNAINVILVGIILVIKIKYLVICKKCHISELQLSKILYDKQKGANWFKKFYPFLIICFLIVAISIAICLILNYTYTPFQYTEQQKKFYDTCVTVFNIIAAIFFEIISWPQFIKCIKYKDTSGISIGWAIFLPVSCYICFAYDLILGIMSHYIYGVLASLICSGSIINTLVLALKIKNRIIAKRLGLSEWTYTNRYLAKKNKKRA